jgi:hypothetical protein
MVRRLALAFASLLTAAAFGQQTEVIDLAEDVVLTKQVRPGSLTITILNLLPAKRAEYAVEYTITPLLEQAIPIQGLLKAPPAAPAAPAPAALAVAAIAPCTAAEIAALAAVVAPAADEKTVAQQRAILVAATNCPQAVQLLPMTELTLPPLDLEPGDVVDMTIRRGTVKTWTRKFSTGKRGDWLTSYGLHFVPNRDRHYSSSSIGNSRFRIRRSRDRESLDYVPTINFAFMRTKDARKSWFHAPIFGLGYDFSSVTGSVGYGLIYNHNFAISVGCQIHQQRRLRGQFEEDQEIGENLDNAALTETTWAPNLYVGLSIRSLTNLFSGR